jgi:hypothetical protein
MTGVEFSPECGLCVTAVLPAGRGVRVRQLDGDRHGMCTWIQPRRMWGERT